VFLLVHALYPHNRELVSLLFIPFSERINIAILANTAVLSVAPGIASSRLLSYREADEARWLIPRNRVTKGDGTATKGPIGFISEPQSAPTRRCNLSVVALASLLA